MKINNKKASPPFRGGLAIYDSYHILRMWWHFKKLFWWNW